MDDLNSFGRVKSPDQILSDRLRKGFCGTCPNEHPVQCFEIKKRIGFGGIHKDKIPLTVEGKVLNGTCLKCHPPMTRSCPPRVGGNERRDAVPSMPNGTMRGLTRQANFRHSKSLPVDSLDEDTPREHRSPQFAEDPKWQQQEQQHQEQKNVEHGNVRNPKSQMAAGHQDANLGNVPSSAQYRKQNGDFPYGHHYPTQQPYDEKSEEQTPKYNVNPTYSPPHSPSQPNDRKIPYAQDSDRDRLAYDHHGVPQARNSPGVPNISNRGDFSTSILEDDVQLDSHHPRDSDRNCSAYDHRRGGEMRPSVNNRAKRNLLEDDVQLNRNHPRDSDRNHSALDHRGGGERGDRKLPSVPSSARRGDASHSSLEDDVQLDNLQMQVQLYLAKNPHHAAKFIPGSGAFMGAELELQDIQDDMSYLTLDTALQGTVNTNVSRRNSPRRLGAIDESSTSSSSSNQRSMSSHQIREPAIPHAAAAPAQDMESYLNIVPPDLKALHDFVEMCNTTGLDKEAIEQLKDALILENNANAKAECMRTDLAMFCLEKLGVLAGKSDENKKMMIFGEDDSAKVSALDAIVEAAEIYKRFVEIQQVVCAVLWSLSINYQKHIAESGGCKVILDAMQIHVETDILQVMALGALKVISFDSVGKSKLLLQGGIAIVAVVMQTHVLNQAIQRDGCVILGSLVVDEANQSTLTVNEKVVDVIIKGMLAHQNSLEVQEAACFTLMTLASSVDNVALIRQHGMSKLSLEYALETQAIDVWVISTLLRRLKLEVVG
ncbi:hypothetical protein ACHAW5_011155 [Stephanodiscus triporus]|uniref:Uncharacterized protein n=1 Tax=Stephanodiscus triporus TaxID=2934178 RepID=A0ABD3MSI4_9STRA